jgi:hypothetical protein
LAGLSEVTLTSEALTKDPEGLPEGLVVISGIASRVDLGSGDVLGNHSRSPLLERVFNRLSRLKESTIGDEGILFIDGGTGTRIISRAVLDDNVSRSGEFAAKIFHKFRYNQ